MLAANLVFAARLYRCSIAGKRNTAFFEAFFSDGFSYVVGISLRGVYADAGSYQAFELGEQMLPGCVGL